MELIKVMKGGLTRSSVVEDKFQISNQFGWNFTWIISDEGQESQEQEEQQQYRN
jgi:hypothetical protein